MITGSIVALVTPMRGLGADIDWQALRALVDWHIEQGTNSIVAVGTTGESSTLSMQEHSQVIRVVVEQAADRIPVIAGTGANSTSEAIDLTQSAADSGADACLLVTPYYNKPTQEGLYQHFRTIAETVDIPQILYNVPGRTACDMLNETVLRLTEVKNIVGIKDATGNIERGVRLIAETPDDFAVYSGDDATARELMLRGGKGNISVTANVAPALMAQMCAAAMAGERNRAEQLDSQLVALHRELFVESNPIPVKWAVAELGKMDNVLRLPMTPLSSAYHHQVRAAMSAAGIV